MRTPISTCFLLSISFLSSPFTGAQTPPTSPAASSVPAAHFTDDSYAKEPYVYDLVQSAVRFEPDGKGSRDLIIRVRIQSESAVHEFGLLVYSFSSKFETLEVVYARVRKPDGTLIETPPSDVQELDSAVSREAPMYTDEREKHIAIKSLAVGDILEAHLHWAIREPIAPGHFWFDYSYFRAGICLKEILEINVPRTLAVKLRNSDPQPFAREEGDRGLYTFQTSNLKKIEESKIPDWEKNYHGIAPPDVQLSSFSSWGEVGQWFDNLVQPKATVTPEIRAKAEELTKGKTTDDEKLHALYDFVSARYRYIGIDLGLSRYTPHSAAEVCCYPCLSGPHQFQVPTRSFVPLSEPVRSRLDRDSPWRFFSLSRRYSGGGTLWSACRKSSGSPGPRRSGSGSSIGPTHQDPGRPTLRLLRALQYRILARC